MSKYIVITGIHGKTKAISEYEKIPGWTTIVVGDEKSKPIKSSNSLIYLSPDDQKKLNYPITVPWSHYSRKNIGYLFAIKNGAEVIFDTDDDNIPMSNWEIPDFTCTEIANSNRYFNAYKHFTSEHVWPRGFPLNEILNPNFLINKSQCNIGICQILAAGDPDVDAIYRLTSNNPVTFCENKQIALNKNTYCPINSQGTFWTKKAFPYLYLPCWVSFRFTDILRGYIAQRLLWEHDLLVSFKSPMIIQDRNEHNILDDFSYEFECYTHVPDIVELLEISSFDGVPIRKLESVYEKLLQNDLVLKAEVESVRFWGESIE